jgi:hypothetical protein
MPTTKHVSIKRAVAFLLHGKELEPWEEEHFFTCDECHEATVSATAAEFGSDDTADQP